MSTTPADAVAGEETAAEPYLPIEEVARRLDLPLGVLIRRVEAGDVSARRSEGPDGARYSVRVSDLGLSRDEPAGSPPAEADKTGEEIAAAEVANGRVELPGTRMPKSWPDKVVPAPAEELAAVPSRPAPEAGGVNGAQARTRPAPAREDAPHRDVGLISGTPRGEVANMALDPRELVAGLLDRWERTLEQRIYAEQRQRFETELNSRQNLLKQLQLELQTARAEHAAAEADKDRRLADRERQISDLQREMSTSREVVSRKRSWFHRG